MYLPSAFRIDDPALRETLALEVVRANPFATLTGVVDGEPFATHCPMIAGQGDGGRLVFEGHVARANPHWNSWRPGQRALGIFNGPHAYVSPTLYTATENVPTWNYVAVHVSGQVVALDDRQAKGEILRRMIRTFEPSYESQWDGLSPAYVERMLDAIVAFRLEPDSVEAKFKLSQNRQPADREGVLAAFAQGSADQRQLADWMRRLGE